MGALSRYIATQNEDFEPMNANYGLLSGFETVRDKKERRRLLAERSYEEIERFKEEIFG